MENMAYMEKMKHMEKLNDRVKEEFHDAKHYAKKAMKCKEMGNMQDARTYYDMASQELGHAVNLHNMAIEVVDKAKMGGEASEYMMEKWDKTHSYYMDHLAKVKYMLAEFTK